MADKDKSYWEVRADLTDQALNSLIQVLMPYQCPDGQAQLQRIREQMADEIASLDAKQATKEA